MRLASIVCRLVLLFSVSSVASSVAGSPTWPEWDVFFDRFVQADGRVVDLTFDHKSTSEGQAYALFFALVANRRDQFDTLLAWTSNNLARGRLGRRLPAWLWGRRDDGEWGVKDENPASDADLWLAYTLLEAARLWQHPDYAVTAHHLLEQIHRREIVQAGAAGTLLLPGPVGFALDDGRFRINPSYLPGFMFRYLATTDPDGPWSSVWDSYMKLAPNVFSAGVAPDLVVVDRDGRVWPDSEAEPSGSYDAIRVYLWAGMSGAADARVIGLLAAYAGLIRRADRPPEKVDPRTGVALASEYSPIGFSGAVLPFLSALGDGPTLARQLELLRVSAARAKQAGEATHYYDQVLLLFGLGWIEGRF